MSFLGRFLVEQGAITEEQLADGLRFQKENNRRIGEMAMDRGVLTPGEVDGICRRQQDDPRLFGDIAVEQRHLSRQDLDQLLFFQKVQHTYLGEALLLCGHIDREQYKRLMERHFALRQSGQVSLRYIQDFFADNRVAETLVAAASRVMRRFVGQELAVVAIGSPVDLADYGETALFHGIIPGGRRLCAGLGLSTPLARAVAEAMCRQGECGQGARAFFEAVLLFFRDMLRDASLLVDEARTAFGEPFPHDREDSLGIRCDSPLGGAGWCVWIEEPAA